MKDKTEIQQAAAARQTDMLAKALDGAAKGDGYWLNAKGRTMPRIYDKGPRVSPFNSLILGLHTDANDFATAHYTSYYDAAKRGESVEAGVKGVPFNWYRWDKYVNRHNSEDVITKTQLNELTEGQRKQYKGLRQREVHTLFNVDQTTMSIQNVEKYRQHCEQYGTADLRGNLKVEEQQLHSTVKAFAEQMRQNMMPIRKDVSGTPHYNPEKDAVYIPNQKHFEHYNDYVQELMRQVVSATGHQQRLAREGMVMNGGKAPSDEAVRYEKLVAELASGVKMQELGLPAKISPENMQYVEQWSKDLRENPNMLEAIESDVNNAVDVIRRAEQGEKLEYASERNKAVVNEVKEGDVDVKFERVQMLRDDNNAWALYVKPANESGFAVHPDKADQNRFFATIKQGNQQTADILRVELAQKYYALAKQNPSLKIDLLNPNTKGIDTSRIERVCLYKTKGENDESKYMCAVKIKDSADVKPREITPLQWQRIWLADDMNAYKTNLAAHIFEKELTQTQSMKDDFPNLKQVDELKAKHPDAVILMRHNDFYESVRSDADIVSKVCDIEKFERVKADKSDSVIMTSFPAPALDTYLPKLIRAGHRIAICEQLEAPKQEIARNEERHSGMRI